MLLEFEPLADGLSGEENAIFHAKMVRCIVKIEVKIGVPPLEEGGIHEIQNPYTMAATGFVVNETGLIISSAHQFESNLKNIETLQICYYSKHFVPARVLTWFPGNDVALLLPIVPKKRKFMRRGYRTFHDYPSIGDDVSVGQQLFAISAFRSPYSLLHYRVASPPPTTISDLDDVAIIIPHSFSSRLRKEFRLIQMDGSIPPGASGSPVFNNKGQVVGLLRGELCQLSYAVHFLELKSFLGHHMPDPESRRSKRKRKGVKHTWINYRWRKRMLRRKEEANGSSSVRKTSPSTSATRYSSIAADENFISGTDQLECLSETGIEPIPAERGYKDSSVSVSRIPPLAYAMSSYSVVPADALPGTCSQAQKEETQLREIQSQNVRSLTIHEDPSFMILDDSSEAKTEHRVTEIEEEQGHASSLEASTDEVLAGKKVMAEKMTSQSVSVEPVFAKLVWEKKQQRRVRGSPFHCISCSKILKSGFRRKNSEMTRRIVTKDFSTSKWQEAASRSPASSSAKLSRKKHERRVRWTPFLCCLYAPMQSYMANLAGVH